MDPLAPLHKKPRPDVFLNGSGPFNLEKPFIPPSMSHQSSNFPPFAAADHSRYKSSSVVDALAAERESLSTSIGSKSKACLKFFSTSGCPYGEGCHFAHYMPGGVVPLSQLTSSNAALSARKEVALVTGLSSLIPTTDRGSVPEGFKSKLCKNFESAEGCRFGDKCHFAHGEKELRKFNVLGGGLDRIPALGSALEQANAPDGFKTRLCKNFQTSEGCRFGEKCHFAHGEKELRKANGSSLAGERSLSFSLGRAPVGLLDEKLLMTAHREPTPPGLAAAASFGAMSTAKISIDASLAGLIIGKGGVNAKSISRLTGARLYVKEHESDSNLRNIEMEGSFDQIKQASTMIRELLVHLDANSAKPAGFGSHNFKTKLCENFPKGTCTFGDRCHFAHGSSELRAAPPV